MMQCITFACEKCGEVHTSGEAPFMLNKLECSEIGEGGACLEARIYAEQETYIKKHFGAKAADMANYGWAVTGDENEIDVCTKIYGHGKLRSIGVYETGEITHEED